MRAAFAGNPAPPGLVHLLLMRGTFIDYRALLVLTGWSCSSRNLGSGLDGLRSRRLHFQPVQVPISNVLVRWECVLLTCWLQRGLRLGHHLRSLQVSSTTSRCQPFLCAHGLFVNSQSGIQLQRWFPANPVRQRVLERRQLWRVRPVQLRPRNILLFRAASLAELRDLRHGLLLRQFHSANVSQRYVCTYSSAINVFAGKFNTAAGASSCTTCSCPTGLLCSLFGTCDACPGGNVISTTYRCLSVCCRLCLQWNDLSLVSHGPVDDRNLSVHAM
jgi:hypothetical protein